MTPPMMAWGMFVFGLSSLPYSELDRQSNWRHPTNSRVGFRPGTQFLGQGDETITLTGTCLPEVTGGRTWIELVRAMADMGSAWPLVEMSGKIYGLYVCESFNDKSSHLMQDGAPQKIDFTITLKRVGDDQLDLIGSLTSVWGYLF